MNYKNPLELYADPNFYAALVAVQSQWQNKDTPMRKKKVLRTNSVGIVKNSSNLLKWMDKTADFHSIAISKLINIKNSSGNHAFSESFLNYLQRFRFKDDIWLINDETVVLADTPILQMEGDLLSLMILQIWIQYWIEPPSTFSEVQQLLQVRRFFNSELRYIQDVIYALDTEPIVNFEATSWQDLLKRIELN